MRRGSDRCSTTTSERWKTLRCSRSRSATLPQGSELKVRVTPRASRARTEFREGVLRVYVTAAPVDGEANKSVIAIVAKRLAVPKSSVSIKRGETSRNKVLWIADVAPNELLERVQEQE